MPFGARTGRNTPSNAKSIFGPAKWLRSLIRPQRGQALAYIDWSAQEVAIAAALSGDAAMLDTVQSGDPYLTFAKMAGLAPGDATKQTHGPVRALCKTAMLGTNYGMGRRSLAVRTGLSTIRAEDLLGKIAVTFPTFWTWAEHEIDLAVLRGRMYTVYGRVRDGERCHGAVVA